MPFAAAEEVREQLEIHMVAKPAEMVEPGDVMLNFTIRNTSDTDARNIYLSSADGLLSEPFGRIPAGETQSFNRQHSVTREELDAGEITYIISHDDPIDPTIKVNYTISAHIRRGDSLPAAEFTRQFSSRFAEPGSTLVVTYRIRNTGNVPLANLRVQDALGDFTGRVERLDVGESRTLISRVTITENSASSAMLDYTMENSEELYTRVLEDVPVQLARSGLETQFSAGYSAFSRDIADVVLLLINTGNVDYRNVRIIDDLYGGVIADSLTIPAGGDPVEISHAYPIRGSDGFRWRVTGVSESGAAIDFVTDLASLQPLGHTEPAMLTLTAATDTPRIRRTGDVNITVTVANNGGSDARDVLLYEENTGTLRRYEIIPAHASAERSFRFHVEKDTAYNFRLEYSDGDGQTYSASASPVSVTIAADGVLPEGARQSFIEFTGTSIKIGGSSTFAVLLIAGCVVLLVLIIMLLVASRRARIQKQLRIAAEKQRRKEEMGKTNRFTPVRPPKNKTKGRN